jgi:essential nuclear protein 1
MADCEIFTVLPVSAMPRASKSTGRTRHDPLHVQLDDDELQEKYGRISRPGKRQKSRKSQDVENDEV